ncbi:MAG: epoxyqueuosine reductase, partial [Syntrophothermus sp.]
MKITNALVIEKARELGFGLIGFAKAEPLKEEISRLDEWLSRKYNAGMAYMENNRDKRLDVRNILPEAVSVISLTYNYNTGIRPEHDSGSGKISRYAFGKDYHLILWEKLDQLIKSLKEADSGFLARSYVDTGPVMDKAWAVRSGIGWMGKHSNVITREEGSWVLLSTIITNNEFEYGSELNDYCGSCTRCIDACPTNAI